MQRSMPGVTILILTWNSCRFLHACIETILKQDYQNYSVFVLDNGSTDSTVELVRKSFPSVHVVENQANIGFSAGNNVGLRKAKTPFVVLVNPDVQVASDWLRQLIEPMVADPQIGVAGCKIYEPDGKILQHAGGYITFPQALPGHYGLGEFDLGQYDEMSDVGYVMGAAIAIRQGVLNSVGLFDEGFFLYYEDVDYCERVRRYGYRVVYVPQSKLVHEESSTTIKGSAFYYGQVHASRWRYMLKYYTVEELLSSTVPTERAWLASQGHQQRLGLQYAYAFTLQRLPFLWTQRIAHHNSSNARAFDNISAAILSLRHDLWIS
ncbi:glycosyltransferase [bacterium]|nr:glycosyltransferase [bacterium]